MIKPSRANTGQGQPVPRIGKGQTPESGTTAQAGKPAATAVSVATAPRRAPESAPITHEQIAVRAHALWEADGRPHGTDWEHWFEAQRQLLGESGAGQAPTPVATMPTPASPRPAAAGSGKPAPAPRVAAEQVREAEERHKAQASDAAKSVKRKHTGGR